MLSLSVPRKPAPMLAMRGAWGRTGVRPTAFGNALGQGIVDEMQASAAEAAAQKAASEETSKRWADKMAQKLADSSSWGYSPNIQDPSLGRSLSLDYSLGGGGSSVEGSPINAGPDSINAKPGDNLTKIAARELGPDATVAQITDRKNQYIALFNGDPNKLSVGQAVNVPPMEKVVDRATYSRALRADFENIVKSAPLGPIPDIIVASNPSSGVESKRTGTEGPMSSLGLVLNTVTPSSTGVVPKWVLDDAQAKLSAGDRGGAYLALYRELGSEQLLVQAQITTYTGVWGSGALAGNALAKREGGNLYNITLDRFSHDIAQGTIDAIRSDIERGGTGRLTNDQFQDADRGVWASKGMGRLFPGNSQFGDVVVGNHALGNGADALFSTGTWNAVKIANWGLNNMLGPSRSDVGEYYANEVGKRPAEYANNKNYTIYGGETDRFITVIDNRNGFVEAFYDKKPSFGSIRMPQLPNVPLASDSLAYQQRQTFYQYLGANMHQSTAR